MCAQIHSRHQSKNVTWTEHKTEQNLRARKEEEEEEISTVWFESIVSLWSNKLSKITRTCVGVDGSLTTDHNSNSHGSIGKM